MRVSMTLTVSLAHVAKCSLRWPASENRAGRPGAITTRSGRVWFCALAAIFVLLASPPARADYGVVSPDALDFGHLVIQHDGDISVGHRISGSSGQGYTGSVGTGLTEWWDGVIELAYDHAPGGEQPSRLTQMVFSSTIELTRPGEDFFDVGLYLEYGQTVMHSNTSGANEITFGPAIGKDIGRTTHTINLFLTREMGPNQETHGFDFNYAWQSRWNLWEALSPAIEVYGDAGTIDHMPRFSRQQFLAGPVLLGSFGFEEIGLGPAGRLRYEIGWLFGATPATTTGALRWHLEVEIPF